MGSKRVLIVDDSRSARHVLKRQLKKHDIQVDEVESAEDGLQYLLYNKPHAIFMDHMMPGMDGLQAVRIIKGNPATGLIPIIMYTSKDGGEVYVGQARALGAVGVIPKGIESAELEDLLSALHLLESDEEPAPVDSLPVNVETPPASPVAVVSPEMEALQREATEEALFRLVKPHLDAHARRIQTSFKTELRGMTEKIQKPEPIPPQRLWQAALGGVVLGALLATGIFSVILSNTQPVATAPAVEVSGLPPLADLAATSSLPPAAFEKQTLLASLETELNREGHFGLQDIPFDDQRLNAVNELAKRLHEEGFEGVVHMTAHAGDFCMIKDKRGRITLAPDDLPVTKCQGFGYEEARLRRQGGLQTAAFAKHVEGEPLVEGSRIRLVAEPAIESVPLIEYPPLDEKMTAGEWNAIARENQRIEIKLVPR